ncbi:MAG: ribosome small subunit-dependent GTPase A, partial [Woeseiaceae bacterium]
GMSASDATVIARFSRRMRLAMAAGAHAEARIKGKKLKPVCGDQVRAEEIPGERDWLITEIVERRNALTRPNQRGETEVLAANIDLVVVVAAAAPEADWFVVDRYLCSAENMNAVAAIVFNKTDVAFGDACRDAMSIYARIGYATAVCSAESGDGCDDFAALFSDRTAIVVGQSGAGKSTLINRMAGEPAQKTAAISDKTGEGRHTTVNSVMLALVNGGSVIDSPGVRDFAPALSSHDEAVIGFREEAQRGVDCRFANCKHLREPDCAVKNAVNAREIDPRRYESYKRTVALTGRLGRDH